VLWFLNLAVLNCLSAQPVESRKFYYYTRSARFSAALAPVSAMKNFLLHIQKLDFQTLNCCPYLIFLHFSLSKSLPDALSVEGENLVVPFLPVASLSA
jgi:hypothetical protein